MVVDKAETEKATSEAEMKELDRQISHDRKLVEFMKLKSRERKEDDDLIAYRKRKGQYMTVDRVDCAYVDE
jgi:hypothetical protein